MNKRAILLSYIREPAVTIFYKKKKKETPFQGRIQYHVHNLVDNKICI